MCVCCQTEYDKLKQCLNLTNAEQLGGGL